MKAKDIMTCPVISVREDATLVEIANTLLENRISGVAVTDGSGKLIGMVSKSDLFLKEKGLPFSAVKLPWLFKDWLDPTQLTERYINSRQHTAADVMEADPICADPEDDIGHVAWIMVKHDLKRVPVVKYGMPVGIITHTDIIRFLAKDKEP